jgi:hypothetical protein
MPGSHYLPMTRMYHWLLLLLLLLLLLPLL